MGYRYKGFEFLGWIFFGPIAAPPNGFMADSAHSFGMSNGFIELGWKEGFQRHLYGVSVPCISRKTIYQLNLKFDDMAGTRVHFLGLRNAMHI
jgi:hypothetical protein